MSKKIKLTSLLILLAVGVWLFFTPHMAATSMKKAAEARDAEKLSTYVNFPSVKESLKSQLSAKLTADVAQKQNGNPFAAFGAAMAMAFINPVVDALITPEGLRQMMRGEKLQLGGGSGQTSTGDAEVVMSYKGINEFWITTQPKNGNEPVTFILTRDGITSWKMTSIRLPL